MWREFKEGEIVENWIWLGGCALAIMRFLIRFMALLTRRLGAFFYRHRNRFTIDSLEKGLTWICEYIDRYKKSFTLFGTIFVGILVVVLLVFLSYTTPWVEQGEKGIQWIPWVKQGPQEPQWTPWGKVVSSIVTPLVAFSITLLGIWRVFRQFQVQVKQVGDQAENARKQMAAEQFKNAVDHLGNDKQAVVLGGVHALHNLAVNFKDDYSKQVFEVLCSFIREATGDPAYRAKITARLKAEEEKEKQKTDEEEPKIEVTSNPRKKARKHKTTSLIVIQTIVDKLFRERIEWDEIDKETGKKRLLYRKNRVNLSGAFLRGVDFSGSHLEGEVVDLRDANVQGTKFLNANLHGAYLIGANLQGADLTSAILQGAKLIEANLQRAELFNAKLQEVNIIDTSLQGAELPGANLQKAKLISVDLQGANLFCANLQGAVLSNANLQGAYLRGTNLRGVQCNDKFIRITIQDAIKNYTGLKTNLSGITLYDDGNALDDDGNALDLDEDGKKAWFRERGANVDDLSVAEVQELFKDRK